MTQNLENCSELGRACVIGSGPMGMLLSATLAASMPVVMVCRNAEAGAHIRRDGLRVHGLEIPPASVAIAPSIDSLRTHDDIGIVFIATKTSSIETVAAELKAVLPSLGHGSSPVYIVSFQNGIDPGRELIERLDHPAVLRMVLALCAVTDTGPGEVRVTMNAVPHAIGTLDNTYEATCRTLAGVLTDGGLHTTFREDIESIVWQKGLMNSATNPIAALINGGMSDILDAPAAALIPRLLREGVAVARAQGVTLPADYEQRTMDLCQSARAHVPSMVEDIRRGRKTEVGQLNRQIIQRAKQLSVSVPTHEVINALIETFDWKIYHGA